MGTSDWSEVEQILDEALEKSGNKRKTFIEERCGENKKLKSWVTELLESIESSQGFLETGSVEKEVLIPDIADSITSEGDSSFIGTQLGAYTIKELIEHGGMGSVYLAHRTDGTFEHRVAIKIIRRGMDTPSNRARFLREQNILARLHHPNIARLYGGGLTDDGLPYLFMEYIDGKPIDQFCDDQRLSIMERLALFNQVCKAVQYAHESLIVHRDLKPDNIMINSNGRVKILDFGIAKLMDPKFQEDAKNQTQPGARMLTLAFAAPEQINGDSITTSVDCYALGTVLYKLLSGLKPFEFKKMKRGEIEKIISLQLPPKPSKRFQELDAEKQKAIAQTRRTTADKLARTISGDLDAIILKALRKEAAPRYRSVEHLEEDIERFINKEPVSARAGNLVYKSKKFLKRHKYAIASVATFLFILLGVSAYYTLQLARERNMAELEAQTTSQVTDFLVDLFQANDPSNNQGELITARQLLAKGEKEINRLDNQPEVKARLLNVLGNIYGVLSEPDKADSLQSHSLSMATSLYNSGNTELASFYYSLAATKHTLGEYDEALDLLESAISAQNKLPGSPKKDLANSLRLQAEILKDNGKLDSAYRAIRESQSIFSSIGATENRDYLKMLKEFGAIQSERGKFPESESIWRQALALSRDLFTSPHPDILSCMQGLAYSLKEQGSFDEAETLYLQGIEFNRKLYGPSHLNTAAIMNNLAGLYYYTSVYQKADSLYTKSYKIQKEVLGESHPNVASILYNRANLKVDMAELATAEKLYREVLKLDINHLGRNHPNVASDYSGLGVLLSKQGKYDEAIEYFSKSMEIRERIYNTNHPYIAYNKRSIAKIMAQTENFKEANTLFKEALAILNNSYEEGHDEITQTIQLYLETLGKWDNALSADSLRTWLSSQ